MKNTLVVSLVVLLAAALGALALSHLTQPAQSVTQAHQTGSLTGPDIPSPYLNWGGVIRWAAVQQFQASSTLCAIQGPAATSTLKSAWMRVDTSPTYATQYEIGYSATAKNSTSTAIVASYQLASGANGAVIATTTLTALVDGLVAPNGWINYNLSTSTLSGTSTATGQCGATFEQL